MAYTYFYFISFFCITFFNVGLANARPLNATVSSDFFKSDNFQEIINKAVDNSLSNVVPELINSAVESSLNNLLPEIINSAVERSVQSSLGNKLPEFVKVTSVSAANSSNMLVLDYSIILLNIFSLLIFAWFVFSFFDWKNLFSDQLKRIDKIKAQLTALQTEGLNKLQLKTLLPKASSGLPVIEPQILDKTDTLNKSSAVEPIEGDAWDQRLGELESSIQNELLNDPKTTSFYKDVILRIQFFIDKKIPFLSEERMAEQFVTFKDFLILKNLYSIMNCYLINKVCQARKLSSGSQCNKLEATWTEWPFSRLPIEPYRDYLLELDLEQLQAEPIGFFKSKSILLAINIYGLNSFASSYGEKQRSTNPNLLLNKLTPLLDLMWVPQLTYSVLNVLKILVQPEKTEKLAQKQKFAFTANDFQRCFLTYQQDQVFVPMGYAPIQNGETRVYLKCSVLVPLCCFLVQIFNPRFWDLVQNQPHKQTFKIFIKQIVDKTLQSGNLVFVNVLMGPLALMEGTIVSEELMEAEADYVATKIAASRSCFAKKRGFGAASSGGVLLFKQKVGFFKYTRARVKSQALPDSAIGSFFHEKRKELKENIRFCRFIVSTLGDQLSLATKQRPAKILLVETVSAKGSNFRSYKSHLLSVFLEQLPNVGTPVQNTWAATHYQIMVEVEKSLATSFPEGSCIPLSQLLAQMPAAKGSFDQEQPTNSHPVVFVDLFFNSNQNQKFSNTKGLMSRDGEIGFILPFIAHNYNSTEATRDSYARLFEVINEFFTTETVVKNLFKISDFEKTVLYVRYLQNLSSPFLASLARNRKEKNNRWDVMSQALDSAVVIANFDLAKVERAHALVKQLRRYVSSAPNDPIVEAFCIFTSCIYNGSNGMDNAEFYKNLDSFFSKPSVEKAYKQIFIEKIMPGFQQQVIAGFANQKKVNHYSQIPLVYIQTGAYIVQDFVLVEIWSWFQNMKSPFFVVAKLEGPSSLLKRTLLTVYDNMAFYQNVVSTFVSQLAVNASFQVQISPKAFFALAVSPPALQEGARSELLDILSKSYSEINQRSKKAVYALFLASHIYMCTFAPFCIFVYLHFSGSKTHQKTPKFWAKILYHALVSEEPLGSSDRFLNACFENIFQKQKQTRRALQMLIDKAQDNKCQLASYITQVWNGCSDRDSIAFLRSLDRLLDAFIENEILLKMLKELLFEYQPRDLDSFFKKYKKSTKTLRSVLNPPQNQPTLAKFQNPQQSQMNLLKQLEDFVLNTTSFTKSDWDRFIDGLVLDPTYFNTVLRIAIKYSLKEIIKNTTTIKKSKKWITQQFKNFEIVRMLLESNQLIANTIAVILSNSYSGYGTSSALDKFQPSLQKFKDSNSLMASVEDECRCAVEKEVACAKPLTDDFIFTQYEFVFSLRKHLVDLKKTNKY